MYKRMENHTLAEFFAQNFEKENIISEIFNYFSYDCLERCNVNPTELDNLVREFKHSENCDIELLASIIETVKIGKEASKDRENELIKLIVEYINNHFAEDISIEKMSEHLHISYYYVCHIFKNKYGISVNTFKKQKRLEIAMRKLAGSKERISDIATFVGFNSISYFTEIFTNAVGFTPTEFRSRYRGICLHDFYRFEDILLAIKMPQKSFLEHGIGDVDIPYETRLIHEPDNTFGFLHEAAIIEYNGTLYASWYNCPQTELKGYTPICGKRSYDGGKSWTDLEIICGDKTEKIMYCPPVYGICDGKLYMLVNQMVAPDHIHSLDLYCLNPESDKFELLWSRAIPLKLNTNVVALPNGKLMLPGRVGELDGFPNTPAVLISDSGKIDAEWRLVKIAENGVLSNGTCLVHPEISVMCVNDVLYMFCRNDLQKVPLVYTSGDFGETWSVACTHDIPYINSKIYTGKLSDGKNYLIANIDTPARSKLAIYFSEKGSGYFSKRMILFDKATTKIEEAIVCHYPAACESNGKLYIIATVNFKNWLKRGAVLFVIDLEKI